MAYSRNIRTIRYKPYAISQLQSGSDRRRQLPAAHPKSPLLNLVFIFVEPARRRAGSASAIFIIHAAVAGTHKQRGLFEPAHRTAEMRAIDREDLKLLPREPPHPTRDIRCRAIPGSGVGIAIGRQPGLIFGKIFQRTEHDPRLRRYIAAKAGEDIPDHGDSQQGRGNSIECAANQEKEPSTGHCRGRRRVDPGSFVAIDLLPPLLTSGSLHLLTTKITKVTKIGQRIQEESKSRKQSCSSFVLFDALRGDIHFRFGCGCLALHQRQCQSLSLLVRLPLCEQTCLSM